MNPLRALESQGQSIWLDFITRQYVAEGKLAQLIQNDGVKGVTSNPTIFQKAITGGKEYDETIQALQRQGTDAGKIFEEVAVADIQAACDAFKPIYQSSKAVDGYVSLEVNPHLSRDTQGTLREARHLYQRVNRPNVMIKIPGTREGLPAIEHAIGDGININVTLIFSLERYQEVMEAWLSGLERLEKSGKPLNATASVASFFVSRVDSAVDGLLDKKIAQASGDEKTKLEALLGKAAIANAREAYRMYRDVRNSSRFERLEAKGALVQRPLWASTGTKNPKYRDVLYVEQLIGRETVNTLPLPTLEAFRDHGQVAETLTGTAGLAAQQLRDLEQAGISMKVVTQQLEQDGLRLFEESYDSLIKSLHEKKEALTR
jgi:transaldolase